MNTQNFIYCILRKIFGFFKTNYFSKFTAPKLITMAQNPIAVANYFIKKANDEGIELTLMKLVKLVYIAHGWHLALKDNELIDEAVQAWKYGPVVPSVYQVFKRFGNAQVTQAGYIVEDGQLITPTITDEDEKHFLDEVWEVYKK
ncbi:MAG TPA: type II toxin-antitoxin system antitoxin SocA domain-containing protein, partial [Flavisolibacter sp.]|nr:type II toxin-antitoxin system antitoxin SocA domain-containing protein [Flavisolibacter sp.]